MTTDEKSLQNIETRICMLVGSVHGIVTQAEIAHRDGAKIMLTETGRYGPMRHSQRRKT